MKWKKNEVQSSEARIEKLANDVRRAAYSSTETLWSAFLWAGELSMVQATEKALRLMVGCGDCMGAMKVLEGICTLLEIVPSEDFTNCQQYPALAQMFMEEFLAKSEDFIFDAGMEDVLALLMDEGQ